MQVIKKRIEVQIPFNNRWCNISIDIGCAPNEMWFYYKGQKRKECRWHTIVTVNPSGYGAWTGNSICHLKDEESFTLQKGVAVAFERIFRIMKTPLANKDNRGIIYEEVFKTLNNDPEVDLFNKRIQAFAYDGPISVGGLYHTLGLLPYPGTSITEVRGF